jgi:hypothetical protein
MNIDDEADEHYIEIPTDVAIFVEKVNKYDIEY